MKVFKFINHASIKCDYRGSSIITDPWYISNAFGSWFQNPSPHQNDIYELVDADDKLGVIISHGHDDHLDDWFVKNHLSDKTFFCSKFASPGLERRLSDKLGVSTNLIGTGQIFGEFNFNQFINSDFTGYDAVITIETPDFLIIHANDNWHKWPDQTIREIKRISEKYDESSVFLLIQFGIADCFPMNYLGVPDEEAYQLINERFENYLSATQSNMKSLSLQHIYYYANQSLYDYKKCRFDGQSMYQLAQKFLQNKGVDFTQLKPGMTVYHGHKTIECSNPEPSLFRYCLRALENFINQGYERSRGDDRNFTVRFKTPEEEVSAEEINYLASNEVWNRILTGNLTLEAIVIGGAGFISKPKVNIRNHHHFISKSAYIAQSIIRTKGLNFFREFAK